MLTNLHIIGVQKAGTTALANFLHQHPNVYVVDGKEAHVFDHPNFQAQGNKQAFAERQYQKRLREYSGQPIICDATPITIYHPQFLQACFEYNPNAKFILVLRDPVERAVSHYNMSRKENKESRTMLWAFLQETLMLKKLKKLDSWSFSSPFRTHSYLTRGRYSKQLTALFSTIPADKVLILNQSELKQNHQQSMFKLFLFLDIHKHPIQAKTVFDTPKPRPHWTDVIAKFYAKAYFFFTGESQGRWTRIINKYQPETEQLN